ncbi:MAG: cytochrome c-type biogenesis protein CcmH [candidate division KSB1 bacterium]|nr:cytochrome c-type biogenesis protein CcmH [candidate division KSB1 bacterium]MDZ7304997.1 cytochrome c-type biogenesis protein CcmH [candidate division KSB1 bacterium]MDZ7314040.1 cytochrome c-type biogenesis protein CcmH [candidate division KSB1 bacterium]
MKTKNLAMVLFWVLFVFSWPQSARTQSPSPNTTDTSRAVSLDEVNKIARQLMAPCCWSETADVHQSPAAEEVRAQIRTALQKGYTESQIINSFVATYGERILAKPKAVGFNLLVWVLPVVAILLGGYGAWRYLRRSSNQSAETRPVKSVSSDDPYEQRLERELKEFDR